MQPNHEAPSAKQQKALDRERARLERAELRDRERAEKAARGPGAWKTTVLPILRVALLAVIAVALVKFAFFPANAPDAAEALYPDGALIDPVIAVETGDIVNDIELEGSVVRDPMTKVLADVQGEIGTIFVTEGASVERGEPIYQIRTEHEPEPVMPTEDEPDPEQPQPYYTFTDVVSPASGVLVGFPFLVGMPVDIGLETGAVQPSSFHVEAPLTAAQQYRLLDQPKTATIEITDGPAPFECEDVEIVEAEAGEDGQGGGAQISCAIPSDVRVFPGLALKVTVAGGSAEGVLTLPTTAVIGTSGQGVVYLPAAEGEDPEAVNVGLGLNDGSFVEITEGLSEGDEVLEFAPGAEPDVDCEDPEQYDPTVCDDFGMFP